MRRLSLLLLLLVPVLVPAANNPAPLPPRTEEEILKSVQLPPGYSATVFARPPQVSYPTAIAASIDGALFVAMDENGTAGREPNQPKKKHGRVVRLRDTDGDGRADEVTQFAAMDSPRGVIWDGPNGHGPGTLYVMHPPKLTAYTDTDGDGDADREEDILTGLSFDLDFRAADHTANNCRLAIDGFIYIALGDYGCVEAKGRDGRSIRHRGGGVVRIRPDGTGLELVAEGTRNIYDVAVSPTLDLFTRDNTNDGGGWDVRLNAVAPGAQFGYPSLFGSFSEDILPPLRELGGGSPTGALWLDEPGLENGLYTLEWGRSAIFRHPVKRTGASFEVTAGSGEVEWMKLVRPIDMEVDAAGRLYIASWEGATFGYNGPNAGYLLRVTKDSQPDGFVPEMTSMDDDGVAELLAKPSATVRLAAQREILRRAARDPRAEFELPKYTDPQLSPEVACASIQTTFELLRLRGALPKELVRALNDPGSAPAIGEKAIACGLAAVGNHPELLQGVEVRGVQAALAAPSPLVRAAAITALVRLGRAEAAGEIVPLVVDADPVVAHLATRALIHLHPVETLLGALDSSSEAVKPGVLRALYWIYEPAVVEGLVARLPEAKDEYRRDLLNALCRLDNQDAPYLDPHEWWGIRPDTSGPVYKPVRWAGSAKVEAALNQEAETATGEEAKWLIQRMYLTKVNLPGLVERMLSASGNDVPARLKAVEGMFRANGELPAKALQELVRTAQETAAAPELQTRALRLLQRAIEQKDGVQAALPIFAALAARDLGGSPLLSAYEDFTHDGRNGRWLKKYQEALSGADAAARTLAAQVLVNLSTGKVGQPYEREDAAAIIAGAWEKPDSAAALLGAVAHSAAKQYSERVKAKLNDPNNAVAEAALFAFQKLGLNASGVSAPLIGRLTYEQVAAAVAQGGEPKAGQEMFFRAGCLACHTVRDDEPPKGPIFSAVVKIYDRAALIESILKPSAKIAQGFESQWFKTKKGETVEGFVTREGGDSLDLRNVLGQTVTLEQGEIVERGRRPQSMMPEGLMAGFTTAEFANLLAWMESLR